MHIDTDSLGIAVIGCGGVAYHSIPLIAVLSNGKPIFFRDADYVEEGNTRRQWIGQEGKSKVNALCEFLSEEGDADGEEEWFWAENAPELREFMGIQKVKNLVIFCLVDSLKAREDIFEAAYWLGLPVPEIHAFENVVLLTAGCSGANAQAHALIMKEGKCVWDAREYGLFENTADEAAEDHCGEQTALSNHAAGTMLFNLWDYITQEWNPGSPILQLCWDKNSRKGPRMYGLYHDENEEESHED
jgi:hypothetical protein